MTSFKHPLISSYTKGATEMTFRGAFVFKEESPNDDPEKDQRIQPGKTGTEKITFDSVLYDTDNFWQPDPGVFVIPSGVKFVRLQAQAIFRMAEKAEWSDPEQDHMHLRQIVIKRNVTPENKDRWYIDNPGSAVGHVNPQRVTTTDVHAVGPVLPVFEGDTFLVDATVSPVEGFILASNGTWFSIEVIS
jgi:hypothetical protein